MKGVGGKGRAWTWDEKQRGEAFTKIFVLFLFTLFFCILYSSISRGLTIKIHYGKGVFRWEKRERERIRIIEKLV